MFSTTFSRQWPLSRSPTARLASGFRLFHESRTIRQRNPVSHGAENYFVDDDDTPPPKDTVFKVDPSSNAAESAYEPPSGPWSWAGAQTEEYRTVSENEPYDMPNSPDISLNYDGKKRYMEGKSLETSEREGQLGTERWGREPKGCS